MLKNIKIRAITKALYHIKKKTHGSHQGKKVSHQSSNDNKVSRFMKEAIEESQKGMRLGKGGPFGAVVVKDGKIIARGHNEVTSANDPTAHAEMVVIRKACEKLHSFQLEGCEIYSSCEPCPMCLGAIYWARPAKLYFANTRKDAAEIGFDDNFIYQELGKKLKERKIPTERISLYEAIKPFQEWKAKKHKIKY